MSIVKSKYLFFDNIKRFFSLNKKTVIIIFSVILICLFTGCFCTIKSGNEFELGEIQNFLLRKFFCNRISIFGFLFLNILFLFFTLFLIFCFSFLRGFSTFIIISFLMYISFQTGVDACIIISCLGSIKGVIFAFLILLPFKIITLFLLFLFSTRLIFFNKQLSKYGNCYVRESEFKILLFFFIISSILLIIQIILLVTLSKFFIFV